MDLTIHASENAFYAILLAIIIVVAIVAIYKNNN